MSLTFVFYFVEDCHNFVLKNNEVIVKTKPICIWLNEAKIEVGSCERNHAGEMKLYFCKYFVQNQLRPSIDCLLIFYSW